jgi:hypothetical protein
MQCLFYRSRGVATRHMVTDGMKECTVLMLRPDSFNLLAIGYSQCPKTKQTSIPVYISVSERTVNLNCYQLRPISGLYTHTNKHTHTHTHIPCKKLYFICITYALWLMEHATPVAMKFHEVRRRIRKQATGAADQGTQQESLLTAEVRCACLTGRGCSPGIRQCKQQYKWLPHSLYSVCSSRPCPAVTLPISLHLTSGVSECPPNNLQISTLQTLTDNCYELRSYLTFPHLDTLTPSLQ